MHGLLKSRASYFLTSSPPWSPVRDFYVPTFCKSVRDHHSPPFLRERYNRFSCHTTAISTRYSLASLCSKAMSLACLACHCMDSSSESFRRYSTSDSDSEGRCGGRMNCWSRKTPVATPEIANSVMTSRVAPQPAATSQGSPGSPRLIRCHAVRRDIFRDWHFDETIEEGQRLWQ